MLLWTLLLLLPLTLADAEPAAEEKPSLPELRDELLLRVKQDQAARNDFVAWMKGHGGGMVKVRQT